MKAKIIVHGHTPHEHFYHASMVQTIDDPVSVCMSPVSVYQKG